jgi:hypothetical protein
MKKTIISTMMIAGLLIMTSFKSHVVVFTGKWDINAETHSMELFILQTGKTVVGTYDIPLGSGKMGYITGMVSGHRLEFEFYEVFYDTTEKSATGSGFLELSKDHKSVHGKVTSIYEGQAYETAWSGIRIY